MTEFTIRYHQYNEELGECEIKIPNDTLNEFLYSFKNLFETELLKAQIRKEKINTFIKFQASKQKIEVLEQLILIARQTTVRLN